MTQDEIKEMAYNAGFSIANGIVTGGINDLKRFAKLVAAKEREECAKVCDGLADMHEKMNQWGSHKTADTLAQAIRARGEQA
jgi:hypothetical protein